MRLALVDFKHASGCSLGTSYGECDNDCGWKFVKQVFESDVVREINKSEWPDSYLPVPPEQVKWLFRNLGVK